MNGNAETNGEKQAEHELALVDRYALEAVQSTYDRTEAKVPPSEAREAFLEALTVLELAYGAGRCPTTSERHLAEKARQTLLRRRRGVRSRDQWRAAVRNQPLRDAVMRRAFAGSSTISEVAREVGVSRTRVRAILREEGAIGEPC